MEPEKFEIDNLYANKKLDEKSKKELIVGISTLQAIGEVLDLYFSKSLKTTAELLNVITKSKK